MVLENDEKDQLDWLCEEWRGVTQSQGKEEYPTYNKKKATRINFIAPTTPTDLPFQPRINKPHVASAILL